MKTIRSINPYSGEKNGEVELFSAEKLTEIIDTAHSAFESWKNTSFEQRKKLFYALAENIEKDIDECARLQTVEMGMLLSDSKAGLQSTANLIRWFADNAQNILGEKEFETSEGFKGMQMHDPLGVIFGIAPWNFPFNQLLRAAVPNMLAGNTQIYKHASNVPLCAQKIEDLFIASGFPKGVYTNLFMSSSLSEHIISNPKIAGVNLTGGERAGSAVGALAGKYIKPAVLELGGNDAFIVAETDNLDAIIDQAVLGRLRNGGQACNGSKRFVVLDKYYDEFCEKYAQKMSEVKLWDPSDESTQLQPLANQSSVKEVQDQVQRSIAAGAKLLTGGKPADMQGTFYEATVLADVTPEIPSFNEEIFGPVASIIRSSNLEESIQIANNSDFGLSAVIFWDDENQIREIAKSVTGGIIYINSRASSKASIPFGWVKKSWIWKENGPEWLKAFTNKKVILY